MEKLSAEQLLAAELAIYADHIRDKRKLLMFDRTMKLQVSNPTRLIDYAVARR